ncbi:MAG: hypothetical protein OXH34_04115 [Bacteroidetes bacterium]|nr:hypothetical protein [Bacteroidota bacterium]
MRPIALWLLVVLGMPRVHGDGHPRAFFVHADTDSVSVAGDSLRGLQEQEDFFQYISGDVRVVHGPTQITADQAIRNVTRRRTSFMRDAVLIDEGDTLRADSLHYDEELEVGWAVGNVRLSDGEVVTLSPSGVHYVDEKRIEFPEGLLLQDSTTTLIGQTGIYWVDNNVADLGGMVEMESRDVKLIADSLTHYRDFSISLARGSVRYQIGSDNDSTWVAGERVEYNAEDSLSVIRGNPLLMHLEYDSLSIDTLLIRAELFRMQDRSGSSHLNASKRVRVWNSSLAALADSMIYARSKDDTSQLIWLYGQPFIWMDDTQLTGDTMKVVMKDGAMDSLFIWGNAFIAQEDSLIKRINQVKGKNVVSTLQSDSVRIFRVGPNAEAVYFSKDEEDQPDGALEASGDEIRMQFAGDSLQTLTFSTDVVGTRYPESALPTGIGLEGLKWEPAQRPTKEELLRDFTTDLFRWEP